MILLTTRYTTTFSTTLTTLIFSIQLITSGIIPKPLVPTSSAGPYLGGNIWGNPDGTGFSQTCVDTNKDGICDSNYTLDPGNVDYLPLTILPPPTGNISDCGTISSPGEYVLNQSILNSGL